MRILLVTIFLSFTLLGFSQVDIGYVTSTKEAMRELIRIADNREDYESITNKADELIASGKVIISNKQYEEAMIQIQNGLKSNISNQEFDWKQVKYDFEKRHLSINDFMKIYE
jgi:hypothetical protein